MQYITTLYTSALRFTQRAGPSFVLLEIAWKLKPALLSLYRWRENSNLTYEGWSLIKWTTTIIINHDVAALSLFGYRLRNYNRTQQIVARLTMVRHARIDQQTRLARKYFKALLKEENSFLLAFLRTCYSWISLASVSIILVQTTLNLNIFWCSVIFVTMITKRPGQRAK